MIEIDSLLFHLFVCLFMYFSFCYILFIGSQEFLKDSGLLIQCISVLMKYGS